MTITDWQQKLQKLEQDGLSIVIEKDGNIIFQSIDPMLKPLYTCLAEKRAQLKGATVYDKIVGRAAAYLCIIGQVKEIYTPLASESAISVLKEHNIKITPGKIIPLIMNRDNTDTCPMEKLAMSCTGPEDFYQALQVRMAGAKK
ncbi:MAG TPA: DUF1893 domain-containing protein [bacterium]|nr:DUF1893 domain-containing protein [bacterium]HPN44289.1 DUF1893 domain-containing protein [bacterium]